MHLSASLGVEQAGSVLSDRLEGGEGAKLLQCDTRESQNIPATVLSFYELPKNGEALLPLATELWVSQTGKPSLASTVQFIDGQNTLSRWG